MCYMWRNLVHRNAFIYFTYAYKPRWSNRNPPIYFRQFKYKTMSISLGLALKSQEIGNTSWYEEVQDVYVKTLVQLSEISDLCNVSSEHSTFLYSRGLILRCFFFLNHITCTVLRLLHAKGRDTACSINLRRSDFGKEQNIHAQRKRMGSAAMLFAIF